VSADKGGWALALATALARVERSEDDVVATGGCGDTEDRDAACPANRESTGPPTAEGTASGDSCRGGTTSAAVDAASDRGLAIREKAGDLHR